MPFENDALPTIVFVYKARCPIAGLDVVERQMLLAHRYRNKLTEIELLRRTRVQEAICQLSPDLDALKTKREQLALDIESMRDEIKAIRKRTRKRSAVPKELSQKLAEAQARRKETWPLLKLARAAAYQSDEAKIALKEIDLRTNEEMKAARKESGLYWGTYGLIERAANQARSSVAPKFHRWFGADRSDPLSVEGATFVSIKYGITVDEALGGSDTRLRIVMEDSRTPSTHRKTAWATVWIRIASEKRQPIWAVVPFALSAKNRELPLDALITGVTLQRKVIGCQRHWSVLFNLAKGGGWTKSDVAKKGYIGIDVGWRLFDGDRLRVARWYGDDGNEGEVSIPIVQAEHWKQPDELRSIRDLEFNPVRDALAEFVIGPTTIPDWIIERTNSIRKWRSQSRLADLVAYWRNARFDGDAEMFDRLTEWRKKERHLYNWETHLRAQLSRWRLNLYRTEIAELSRRYHVAYIEDTNWREMARRPKPEESSDGGASKYWMRAASPGLFLRCVQERFAESVKIPAENTTRTCSKCGTMMEFDARAHVCVTCSGCGTRWDQDANAARNLLALGLEFSKKAKVAKAAS